MLLCYCGTAFGWGKSGHDAIAYIAECNLTPKAKKKIEKYLDGRSIVYYASWMDVYRHTPAYKVTSGWHGDRVDADGKYVPNAKGDALQCIEEAISRLKDYRSLDDSTVLVSIKYLVHLVGDMHCPVHVKYPWYKNFKFDLNGRPSEFHSFWDSGVLDLNHRWGYVEYRHQLDRLTKKEIRAVTAGTPRDWLEESARDCRVIYEWTKPGQTFNKDEARDLLNTVHPFAEEQILKAGYRLAAVLNQLFLQGPSCYQFLQVRYEKVFCSRCAAYDDGRLRKRRPGQEARRHDMETRQDGGNPGRGRR